MLLCLTRAKVPLRNSDFCSSWWQCDSNHSRLPKTLLTLCNYKNVGLFSQATVLPGAVKSLTSATLCEAGASSGIKSPYVHASLLLPSTLCATWWLCLFPWLTLLLSAGSRSFSQNILIHIVTASYLSSYMSLLSFMSIQTLGS